MMLSVVIPAYNECELIKYTVTSIRDTLGEESIECELILVDDGSTDSTWKEIKSESKKYSNVRGISFSRNFGKESAIFAGLCEAKGDCAVVIDCDLQQPPRKIVEMYNLWKEGYQIVEGVKIDRGNENFLHSFAASSFYRIMSEATNKDFKNASDFKLLDRKAIDVITSIPEKNMFFRAMSAWVGFKTAEVKYNVEERKSGTSKWSIISLIKYAINNITSFTDMPMQFVTILGALLLIISLVLATIALYQKIVGQALGGFTTVIILLSFSSSVIMISLGIIGIYLSKIYEEVRQRPRYIVAERTDILS